MGYTVKVDNVLCPDDIGQLIRLECVLYDGEKEIIRENVVYTGGINDAEIEIAVKSWANPYLDRSKDKREIPNLTIIGKEIIIESEPGEILIDGK